MKHAIIEIIVTDPFSGREKARGRMETFEVEGAAGERSLRLTQPEVIGSREAIESALHDIAVLNPIRLAEARTA